MRITMPPIRTQRHLEGTIKLQRYICLGVFKKDLDKPLSVMLPLGYGASMNASAVASLSPPTTQLLCPKCHQRLFLQDVIDPLEDQLTTWEYRCLNCGHRILNKTSQL